MTNTSPLDYFRQSLLESETEIGPAVVTVPPSTGDPASKGPCGVSDVEGNIAFFNCLEIGVGLKVPLGAGALSTAFTLPTDGSVHQLPLVTQGNPPFTIPVVGGFFVLPLTGSYMFNFNITMHVTASAQWFVSAFLVNGSLATVVANTLSFPSALTNPVAFTLNSLGYLFPGQVGSIYGQIGIGLSVLGVTAATVDTVDAQVDYIGSNPGG